MAEAADADGVASLTSGASSAINEALVRMPRQQPQQGVEAKVRRRRHALRGSPSTAPADRSATQPATAVFRQGGTDCRSL